MTNSLGYIQNGNNFIKCPTKYPFFGNLEESINHIVVNYLDSFRPLFFVKEDGDDRLVKLECKGDQVIKSYVLDLFNFDKEFAALSE